MENKGHHNMKRGIPVLIIGAFLVAGYLTARPFSASLDSQGAIKASGIIEAEEALVSTEVGGRIKELKVEEGDSVNAGDVVLLIDDALLGARLNEAEAAAAVARAKLAQIKSGADDEAVAVARAALVQAQTGEKGANAALNDAKTIRDNPQELNAKIDAARFQLDAATHTLNQAVAGKDSAEETKDLAARTAEVLENGIAVTINVGGHDIQRGIGFGPGEIEQARYNRTLTSHQWWAAWEQVNLAQAQKNAAEANLRDLIEMRDHPFSFNAAVNNAEARASEATAVTALADSQLKAILNGATPQDLAIAQAQVDQAEAAIGMARVQKAKMSLAAPISGLVSKRSVNLGDMAAPGAPLLTISDLKKMTLTIYVPEYRVGQIRLGQHVTVKVDSFPSQNYDAEITYISDTTEFTPKNIQTEKDRVNTVYAVKTRLDNADGRLKPGMPADATIEVTQ